MYYRYVLFLIVAVFFSGCATLPSLPPRYIVKASDVLDAVECQLQQAVMQQFPDHKWLKTWAAQMTLTLEVNRSAGGSASVDWAIPVGLPAQTLGINATVDGTGRATRRGTITYNLLINEVLKRNCTDAPADSSRPYFHGDVGVGSWLNEVTSSMGTDDVIQVPDKFGHTLEFGLSVNAAVKPTVTFVNLTASAGVEVHPSDVYTLDLAFTDVPSAQPQHVFVTNWPSSMTGERFTSKTLPRFHKRGAEPAGVPRGISPALRDRLDRITQQLQLLGLNNFRR
jgi:hypothetical protein